MSQHQSAPEVEQQHLQAFGPDLGPLYHALHNDVIWLHAKWREYRKLFGQSEQRVELLNDTAAFFFRVVQDVIWDDILLHIARLTDPPTQGRNENLTLHRLQVTVADPGLAHELHQLAQTVGDKTQFARQRRNKQLAQQDLALAIDIQATPLPGVSRQQIEEALASMRAVMNRVHSAYLNSEVAFDHFLTHEDADALIYHLGVAARYEECRQERLHQGTILAEDVEPPPAI